MMDYQAVTPTRLLNMLKVQHDVLGFGVLALVKHLRVISNSG